MSEPWMEKEDSHLHSKFEICSIGNVFNSNERGPMDPIKFTLQREDGVLGSATISNAQFIDMIKKLHEWYLSVNDWLIYWDDMEYEEVAPGGIVREKKEEKGQ